MIVVDATLDRSNLRIGPGPVVLVASLLAVCALGLALFIGFIPGRVASRDAYDAIVQMSTREEATLACRACGVVEDVRAIDMPLSSRDVSLPGAADLLGATAAAVVGDGDSYRTAADKNFLVTLRMVDGRRYVARVAGAQAYAVGDAVTLSANGKLTTGGTES